MKEVKKMKLLKWMKQLKRLRNPATNPDLPEFGLQVLQQTQEFFDLLVKGEKHCHY